MLDRPGNSQSFFLIAQLGPGVRAAYSTRSVNRETLPDFLEATDMIPSRVKWVKQVHDSEVVEIRDPNHATESLEADGLITNIPGIALGIRTADCLPVFLASQSTHTVALVHGGWRGVEKKIIEKTIERFWKGYGVRPQDLKAYLGPAIRRCCYQVGPEFSRYFPREFLIPTPEGFRFDLAGDVKRRFWEKGVGVDAVHDGQDCTVCQNDLFYSYRHEKTEERIFSVIQIVA